MVKKGEDAGCDASEGEVSLSEPRPTIRAELAAYWTECDFPTEDPE